MVGPDETLYIIDYPDTETASVIALEPIEPGVVPAYCIHGRTTCIRCGDWVWLGHETLDIVREGIARPLCLPCTGDLLPGHTPDHRVEDSWCVDDE